MSKKKSALVLSGGAALGAAHIGALSELENEYFFDEFFGVSAGAIVSAGYALGISCNQMSKILSQQNFFSLFLDFSKSDFGMVSGKKILSFFDDLYEGKTFADLEKNGKKLRVYATDFSTGMQVEINSGNIARGVFASMCLPVVFEPFVYDDKWLVDGGISQNFPLDKAIEKYSGDQIIGVDVGTAFDRNTDFSKKQFLKKPLHIKRSLERVFKIMFFSQQSYFPKDDRVKIFCPDVSLFSGMDIGKLSEIEEKGREAVKNKA